MSPQRVRRAFTAEFKAGVVQIHQTTGKSVTLIAKELELTPSAVQRWVTQAEVDSGQREGLTTAEAEKLASMERQLRRVTEERDLLKRAVAFFAKETR